MDDDKTIICKDCDTPFVWSAGEQAFFKSKNFTEVPKRCKPCRTIRRAQQAQLAAEERRPWDAAAEDRASVARRDKYAAQRGEQ